ncbi:MAG: hypothetical protein WDM86_01175 [Rhizomicrobium sp.]
MKSFLPVVAAGAGTLLLAGSVALAASRPAVHDITIPLPGGGVEHVQYTGDVAPKIVFDAHPFFWTVPANRTRPFADFEALDAAMDRQMDAMLRQVQALQAPNGGLNDAARRALPPGTSSSSWIVTTNGARSCVRTIQIRAPETGGKPQVVSQTSGDCGDPAAPAAARPIQARWSAAPEPKGRSAL